VGSNYSAVAIGIMGIYTKNHNDFKGLWGIDFPIGLWYNMGMKDNKKLANHQGKNNTERSATNL